ncbi:MAG: hypothetical protein KKC54_02160 [Nanoarchaeota archaeon]|nr:hypothetical protein [Nanoarchaeota archaeon]MBU1945750.1 hypothetical protein [Nanoarchaeota archaeon]
MNKQNVLLDFEDFLDSYENKNYVSSSIKKKFPIYLEDSLTEEYAYLIGKVIGDGHLDSKFTLKLIGKEKDLITLRDLIINKFEIDANRFSIRKRVNKGVSHLLQINCAFLGRILSLLGAPRGNKTKKAFNVPSWILADKRFKKLFLQALLEDELTTIKIRKCNYSNRPRLKLAKREELTSNLREFMQQVKEAIESFGVECSHISRPIETKTRCQDLYFHIKPNKRNIIKFKEEIGFRLNQDKVEKLNHCYNILKKTV